MASNLTRKEMKQDKFAVEVEHTVDFFAAHRQSTLRYGAIALAVILIVAAVFYLWCLFVLMRPRRQIRKASRGIHTSPPRHST